MIGRLKPKPVLDISMLLVTRNEAEVATTSTEGIGYTGNMCLVCHVGVIVRKKSTHMDSADQTDQADYPN